MTHEYDGSCYHCHMNTCPSLSVAQHAHRAFQEADGPSPVRVPQFLQDGAGQARTQGWQEVGSRHRDDARLLVVAELRDAVPACHRQDAAQVARRRRLAAVSVATESSLSIDIRGSNVVSFMQSGRGAVLLAYGMAVNDGATLQKGEIWTKNSRRKLWMR